MRLLKARLAAKLVEIFVGGLSLKITDFMKRSVSRSHGFGKG